MWLVLWYLVLGIIFFLLISSVVAKKIIWKQENQWNKFEDFTLKENVIFVLKFFLKLTLIIISIPIIYYILIVLLWLKI